MMRYNTFAYVVNHVNLTISRKEGSTRMVLTRRAYPFIRLLHRLGCINRFVVSRRVVKNLPETNVHVSALFYKHTPFFSGLRLVSTPSKRHTVTLKALRILNGSLRASTIILSTPFGLMCHNEALQKRTGGLIVAVLS